MLFYCMDPRFYQKICKTMVFFFKKKFRYLKSRIRTKFHRLLFIFNSFIIFGIYFSISPIQTCQKIIEIFVVFQSKEQTFFQQILNISQSSFTKIEICEIFFFQNSVVQYLIFFIFLIFFTFSFQFRLSVLVKKF